ncbi:hypothetical protein LINGRAHAP2_LOCUS12150 [Linum grandiflorum]
MQKLSAYRASVLVLLLVLMKTSIKITSADGDVCLDPGPSGTYNVACGRANIAPEPEIIQKLLNGIRTEYILNVYPHPTLCMYPIRYDHREIMVHGYAFCSKGTTGRGCDLCLGSAIHVIANTCDAGAVAVQASSERCCIRYESKPFCN